MRLKYVPSKPSAIDGDKKMITSVQLNNHITTTSREMAFADHLISLAVAENWETCLD